MTDQRQDPRQSLTDAEVRVIDDESGVAFTALGSNLSTSGLAFTAPMEPPVGASMDVTVAGADALRAKLEVTRVRSTDTGFEVAGRLRRKR